MQGASAAAPSASTRAAPSTPNGPAPSNSSAPPEVRLVNRTLAPKAVEPVDDEPDEKLFAPEGSAEGCASGECLPDGTPVQPPAPAAPAPARVAPAAVPNNQLDRWKLAVDAVRAASPRHGKSLSHGRFVGMEPGTVRIAFPADAAFHRTTVFGMSRQLIEDELTKHFGRPTKVAEDNTTQALKAAAPSIAEDEARETSARHSAIDARVSHHPAIKSVLRILGGTVEHVQYLEPVREAPSLVPAASATPDDE